MNPDPKFQDKRKYLRLEYDGASCVIDPKELSAFTHDGEAGELVITEVWMTPHEFENLPEFAGF